MAATLAVVAVGPQVFAQVGTGSPQEAAVASVRPIEFSVPVTGLSVENAEKALEPLRTFTMTEYVCAKCADTRLAAGECRACKTKLEARSRPAFDRVTAAPDHTKIAFRLAPGAMVRLSNIEPLLRSNAVEVEREQVTIHSPAGLVYGGGSAAEDATRLEKAIRDAGHTDAVSRYDADSRDVVVTFERNPPTWKRLTEIGAGLTERPLQLRDVVWSARPTRTS